MSVIQDPARQTVTTILYKEKLATVMHNVPIRREPRTYDSQSITGNRTVNGIDCIGRKVICRDMKAGSSTDCGTAWYSTTYDLLVSIEDAETFPDGTKRRSSWERYDVAISAEPETQLFEIPAGFQIKDE
ncbi:MAG TPA: hypothetical protein VN442_11915 [Bryobacteraceae bacterium]|nr:hypothetical protein [Bryobacteraceae bacterium]